MLKLSQITRDFIARQFLVSGQPVQDKPVVWSMCGLPASGKSTFIQMQIDAGVFDPEAFVLNPDNLKPLCIEYQKTLEEVGAVQAYEAWCMPIRDLAYELCDTAIKQRRNIIIDMGVTREEEYQRLAEIKKLGYVIHMYHISCPVNESIRRAALREDIDGDRHTPEATIKGRSNTLQPLLPRYKELADTWIEIDNSDLSQPFRPILPSDSIGRAL